MVEKTTRTRNVRPEDKRPERIPLHDQKQDLITVIQKKGYVSRWVNDTDDRVARFKLAGWRVVDTPELKVGDTGVKNNNETLGSGARKHMGKGVYAILMEIPNKLYKEDQVAKQRELDKVHGAIEHKLTDEKLNRYGKLKDETTFSKNK